MIQNQKLNRLQLISRWFTYTRENGTSKNCLSHRMKKEARGGHQFERSKLIVCKLIIHIIISAHFFATCTFSFWFCINSYVFRSNKMNMKSVIWKKRPFQFFMNISRIFASIALNLSSFDVKLNSTSNDAQFKGGWQYQAV